MPSKNSSKRNGPDLVNCGHDVTREKIVLILAVAISAIVGAAAGATVSILLAGAANFSFLEGSFTGTMSEVDVDRQIIELIEDEQATIGVVDRVAPAVVSVVLKQPRGEVLINSPFFDPFFVPPEEEQDPNELVEVGAGSGFFVTEDGLIVTNKHVINSPGAQLFIVTDDGVELPAEMVAQDVFLDIAVLRVEGEGYPTLPLGDSESIRVGQTVIAIGNTLSEYQNTVTKGVVSGVNRRVAAGTQFGSAEIIERAIQTDAAINPGNSGGPLINLFGQVVGVNTATSFEGQSIGFAIPANEVKRIVADVESTGKIVRPWLGVRYMSLNKDLAEEHDLYVTKGAFLFGDEENSAVFEDSPADRAGLRNGDVVLEVDGLAVSETRTLGHLISNRRPGESVVLKVARNEGIIELMVVLEELDPSVLE